VNCRLDGGYACGFYFPFCNFSTEIRMRISRRKFIRTSTAALGAVTLLGQTSAAQVRRRPRTVDVLSNLTWESFFIYQNTDFTFSDQNGNQRVLNLVKMTDLKPANFQQRFPGEECFAMTFSGPYSLRPWTQDTYSVEHFALGKFDLFITSGGRLRRSDFYQALINRIIA